MSIWLPQASRRLAGRGTTSLKYVPGGLSSVRQLPRYFTPVIYQNQLIPFHHAHTWASATTCRSYATSTQPKEASPTSSNVESTSNVPAEPAKPWKTRVWEKVKHEAAYYWHGSKLLASELRISLRLVFSLLKGNTLTRREKRQVGLHFQSQQAIR